jgi:hypothetical protein
LAGAAARASVALRDSRRRVAGLAGAAAAIGAAR